MSRTKTVVFAAVAIYIGGYYALFNPNAVGFRYPSRFPAAAYRCESRWFPTSTIYAPMDRIDYFLRPERHRHLANGLAHYVQMGVFRDRWWEKRW
jgi:hypothetical protein